MGARIEEQDLELSMAMDPESFAAKAMNPKKRKPDPETEGEGISRHPTAKRKPDGATETPMASASASPSASQEPPTAEMETPSESHSRSASGITEPPRARPTHTPKTPGDGTDEERQEEALVTATAVENDLDRLPLEVMSPEEQLLTGDPNQDIEQLDYHMCPEIVSAREHVDPVIRQLMTALSAKKSTEEEDDFLMKFIPTCFDDTYDSLMEREIPLDEDIQSALGVAVESFPRLLPQVFNIYRRAVKRMFARQAEQRRQSLEEEEASQETQKGEQHPRVYSESARRKNTRRALGCGSQNNSH